MLNRSKSSSDAAFLLLKNQRYDGSVVAFYYSVLQRMMFALNDAEIRPLPYDRQNPLNEDIHFKILTEITNRITIKKEEESFKEQFEELFNYRKKADYQSEQITQEECAECRMLHECLMARLNHLFPQR